jgi:NAD(P) transhydrogenase subunit beta
MDVINPRFAETDVALVVGACDVVNSAAIETDGTPISGMPILMAHEAGKVIVCNLDDRPGYSGVRNPLYDSAGTIMLLGDAKSTLEGLTRNLQSVPDAGPAGAEHKEEDILASAAKLLTDARSVVIIPGYGMALAQAQFKVAELAGRLQQSGRTVRFAIHPVAGRMPGHMNVLLAEADVPYDYLMEMDAINPEFPQTDVAMIVGASDVVNPAAIQSEGTPISGMPILSAHEARHVIVCNLDTKPGYSGVDNPLYTGPNTLLLLGDAKESISALIRIIDG